MDYIKLSSSNDDEVMFRSMSLRLIKESTQGMDVIDRLSLRYKYIIDAILIKNNLNRNLNNVYKGSYKYDFCVNNEGLTIDKLKISKRHKDYIRVKTHLSNSKLIDIKKRFEIDLSKLTLVN